MKVFLFLLLAFSSQLTSAQEYCGEIERLEKRLELLKDKCGKIVKCDTFGGSGLSPEEAIRLCVASSYSRSMCIEYLKCENLDVVKCQSFGGYALTKEEAIKNCVERSYSRSMCIDYLKCE